jgi:hypothetical protein
MRHQDTREWMIDDGTFWQHWLHKKWVYVVLSRDEFEILKRNHPNNSFHIIKETKKNLLISNNPALRKNNTP